MAYEVIARKWRPQIFEEVIGQEHITRTLLNAINSDRLAHAYLFSGARGVGKTSVARILAKAINCSDNQEGNPCNKCASCNEIGAGSSVDVQEIDGASNRGIDEIRELRENIKYMPSSSKFRVYIIDEVHMLTLPAFNALLKTLEEPPSHVKFIFATTEPHKVPVTILSRCQRFDFKRISPNRIVDHLKRITREEKIDISSSGLNIIAREAEGSMRDAQSLLDQVASFTGAKVDDKAIMDILGIVDRDLIFDSSLAIIENMPEKCIRIVEQIYNYGYDLKEFYRALMDQFRNLLICIVTPQSDILDLTEDDIVELMKQAKKAGLEKLQQSLNILITREEDLRYSSHPRLLLETIMIRLCRIGDLLSFDELIQKISDLEKRIATYNSGALGISPHQITDIHQEYQEEKQHDGEMASPDDMSVEKDWDGFLKYLESKSSLFFNVMKEWKCGVISDDSIELIKEGNSFSANYLDEPENLKKFSEFCNTYFERDIRVKLIGDEPKEKKKAGTKQQRKEKDNNPSELPQPVQEVLQMFQGEIKGEVIQEEKP